MVFRLSGLLLLQHRLLLAEQLLELAHLLTQLPRFTDSYLTQMLALMPVELPLELHSLEYDADVVDKCRTLLPAGLLGTLLLIELLFHFLHSAQKL